MRCRFSLTRLLGLLLVLALWMGTAGTSALAPGELHVPSERYEAIQAAIEAASDGDTILIDPDTYVENLRIDKYNLTLRGTGGPSQVIVQARFADEPVVTLTERADDVRLISLTLKGGRRGLQARDSRSLTLSKLIVESNEGEGVFLERVDGGELLDSRVADNQGTGVFLTRTNFALTGNQIVDNEGHGVELVNIKPVDLRQNLIQGNAWCGLTADPASVSEWERNITGGDNAIFGNGGGDLCDAIADRQDLLDRNPPPAPRNLTVTPSEWTNQGRFVIDWEDPRDVAGIVAYWFKVGSVPTGPKGGSRREIGQKPLIIENPHEGEHPVFVWLEDGMGNVSHQYKAQGTLMFDTSPPIITPVLTPEPNENDWNNSNVTVRFECRDELSGVEICTPTEPVLLTEEGKDQVVEATAKDKLGNTSTLEIKVSIDKTEPVIKVGEPQGELGREGWYRSDVTVTYTAQDNHSGFANGKLTTEGTVRTSGEGTRRTNVIRVSDLAGNEARVVAGPFKIDKTSPAGSLRINGGASLTQSTTVQLDFEAQDRAGVEVGSGLAGVRFSNDGQTWSDWEPFATIKRDWDLSAFGGDPNQGMKTVFAQLRDRAGNTCEPLSAQIAFSLAQPPVAQFAFSPEKPRPGMSVTFDASGSSSPDGAIARYTWDFGDGSEEESLTVPIIEHLYDSAGTFTVRLTVTDEKELMASTTQGIVVQPGAATLTVPSLQFMTIQAAIEASLPGDTILLQPGLYGINLVIEKSLTIKGSNTKQVIVRGREANRPVIQVASGQGY